MPETRYECSWCHEIVSASAVTRQAAGACTGQPLHADHVLIQNHSGLRNRLPFESERRMTPMTRDQAPESDVRIGRAPIGSAVLAGR
jgi:hypothetical protein